MIAGCHPGECHYVSGNIKALRRFKLLKKMLKQLGVEEERVQIVWASASEGIVLAEAVNKMTEEIRKLGPLNWNQTVLGGGNGHGKMASIEAETEAEEV
jgi:F420-non-reducing hydrogenase iron-sulfur subunit